MSQDVLRELQGKVTYSNIKYDLEKLFVFLDTEIQNGEGHVPESDRLFVAQFALLEAQLLSAPRSPQGTIDSDILKVVNKQVQVLKSQLGVDYTVEGFDAVIRTLNPDGMTKITKVYAGKIWSGVKYLFQSLKLMVTDIVYAIRLIQTVVGGTKLKPREVRAFKRFGKDCACFIPYAVISIIPMTPWGHGIVFGFLARSFPEFLPTWFDATRHNLVNMSRELGYENIQVDVDWGSRRKRILKSANKQRRRLFGAISEKTGEIVQSFGEGWIDKNSTTMMNMDDDGIES